MERSSALSADLDMVCRLDIEFSHTCETVFRDCHYVYMYMNRTNPL